MKERPRRNTALLEVLGATSLLGQETSMPVLGLILLKHKEHSHSWLHRQAQRAEDSGTAGSQVAVLLSGGAEKVGGRHFHLVVAIFRDDKNYSDFL